MDEVDVPSGDLSWGDVAVVVVFLVILVLGYILGNAAVPEEAPVEDQEPPISNEGP